MRAETVEHLISALETFDGDQCLSIGHSHGRPCIRVHRYNMAVECTIIIPGDMECPL